MDVQLRDCQATGLAWISSKSAGLVLENVPMYCVTLVCCPAGEYVAEPGSMPCQAWVFLWQGQPMASMSGEGLCSCLEAAQLTCFSLAVLKLSLAMLEKLCSLCSQGC